MVSIVHLTLGVDHALVLFNGLIDPDFNVVDRSDVSVFSHKYAVHGLHVVVVSCIVLRLNIHIFRIQSMRRAPTFIGGTRTPIVKFPILLIRVFPPCEL